ncbi:MAG: hypothetical protein MO852_12170, partial [Candidatus Devosia euplotis]|nr:hypothetical protein [Candidatus Devosia euplotis]
MSFTRLSAGNWGGVCFDDELKAGGSVTASVLSGSGRVRVAAADAPALGGLYDLLGTPLDWRAFLGRLAPLEALVDLVPGDGGEVQILTIGSALGAAKLDLRAQLDGGLVAMS